MERAQIVPPRRKPGEIRLRGKRALLTYGGEALTVFGNLPIVARECGQDRTGQQPRLQPVGEPEERPGAFAMTLDKPRLDHDLEVGGRSAAGTDPGCP